MLEKLLEPDSILEKKTLRLLTDTNQGMWATWVVL